MIQTVLLFILGLILICLGGDRLVDAAVAIAKKLGIPQIVVGATIVRVRHFLKFWFPQPQRLTDPQRLQPEMRSAPSSAILH